jgi:C-terminal processing protease CtpA/Prc
VLALRQVPSVVIVGDTTGGSSGRPLTRELSNGWTYELSTWIEYTTEQRTIEDAGIAPAVLIARSVATIATANRRDAVLDRVMTLAAAVR